QELQIGARNITSISTGAPSDAHPFGTLATGSTTGVIEVWNLANTTTAKFTLVGHEKPITSLYMDGDDAVISTSLDGFIRVWDQEVCVKELNNSFEGYTDAVRISSGEIVAATNGGLLEVWDAGRITRTISANKDGVRSIVNLAGSRFATAGARNSLIIWDDDGNPMQILNGHNAHVKCLTETTSGLMFSSDANGSDQRRQHTDTGRLQEPTAAIPDFKDHCTKLED
ncbi:hypothetical protein BGZ74_000552, partial [Mortierella antarctica]